VSAYVQLAKHGDLLSLLPCLHHEFLTTGIKPSLIVGRDYRAIPDAVDYLNVVQFDGDPQDLDGAIRFAKNRFEGVKIPQLHGEGFQFQHRHPSFQYDQWDRAGWLDKWDTLPLILPRRKSNLEIPIEPFIVYGDHSQSSPFLHKEDLAEVLKQNFPQHSIVRLSSVLAPHPLELLALIDAADLIVTVDSMPLHLSKAVNKPAIALVGDNLSRWHGSAWSSRFAIHCRYGDYQRRKDELVKAAKAALNNSLLKSTPIAADMGGYNPSIIRFGNKTLTTFRYHPARSWKTRLAITDGHKASDIVFPASMDEFSKEDARLFTHMGKLMMTYVVAKALPVGHQFRCVVGYGMLNFREGRWRIDEHIQPAFQNNDWSGTVKNWVPFEHDGKIHFIYGNQFGEQIVIRVEGDKVTGEYKTPEAKWEHGEIRGGAIVPHEGNLLRFFHSRTGENHWTPGATFQYHVGALLMESNPPFKVIKVGSSPILSGDERYMPGCFHWKNNVAIAYGVVKDDDGFILSVGRNDSSCEAVKLKFGDLNL